MPSTLKYILNRESYILLTWKVTQITIYCYKLGMVVHACNPRTWKAKVEGLQQVQDQSELQSEPKIILDTK